MGKKRTACVEYGPYGLVHLVELRAYRDCGHDSAMWCEGGSTAWADPPIVPGPPTCLYCMAATRPKELRDCRNE